jgi:hypothetical protein
VLGRIGAVLLLVLPGAAAARSLALVVGNDSYVEIEPLQKARADTATCSAALASRSLWRPTSTRARCG